MSRSSSAMRGHTAGVSESSDIADGTSPTTFAPALLSVHEAARILGVTVSWVYEHLRPTVQDPLPFVKLGKYVRFHPDDLAAYINDKRRAHAGQRLR